MGMFQNDPPPLFVPDLKKPAGAAVDDAGMVTCIACSTKLPLAQADIVGQGYRCAPCSAKAQIQNLATGRSDMADNLSSEDRAAMRAFGFKAIAGGVAMILGGVAALAVGLRRWPFYLMGAGVASIGVGWQRVSASR